MSPRTHPMPDPTPSGQNPNNQTLPRWMNLQECLQAIAPDGPDGQMWTRRVRRLAEAVLVFAAAEPEEIPPGIVLHMLDVVFMGKMWQKYPESAALLGSYLQSLPGFRADRIESPGELVLGLHGYVSRPLARQGSDARLMMEAMLSGLRDGKVTFDLDRALEESTFAKTQERL